MATSYISDGSKQTKASRFVCEIRQKTSTTAPPAEPVIRLGRPASGKQALKDTASLSGTSPHNSLPGTSPQNSDNMVGTNENRSSKKRTPSCDASELLDRIHAANDADENVTKASPSRQLRCATPTESILDCYRVSDKHEEDATSEDEKSRKVSKIFSRLENSVELTSQDHQISKNETADILKPQKGIVTSNPRKRRKIVVVRNKPSVTVSERTVGSEIHKGQEKCYPKRTEQKPQSSLWKAMSSAKW